MSLADKLDRFIARYNATVQWDSDGPTVWLAMFGQDDGPALTARVVRRNGWWWLYAFRTDRTFAKPVKLHRNITRAKRIAEATCRTAPWSLKWSDVEGPSRT